MRVIAAIWACLALLLPGVIHAQGYPTQPILMIVPFQPGGPVDVVPRMIAEKLTQSLKVPVLVENRPGAGGNVGAAYVAKTQPDGYTLLSFAGGVLTTNPWLFRNAPFDPEKDFVPIVNFASTPNVLVVSPDIGVSSVKELIEKAKASGTAITYSSPGIGTSPHLCGELITHMDSRLPLTHVPYKGGAEAVRDVVAGHIQLSCSNLPNVVSLVQRGTLRALAVTSLQRHPLFPDTPTMDEVGFKGFELLGWFGLAAPAGTPQAVVDRLNTEINRVLKDPEIVQRLAKLGLSPVGGTQSEFRQFIKAESTKWRTLIEQQGISIK